MDVTKIADDLAERMVTQLRVRGTGLADVASAAGRKLPKHLQAEVAVITDAVQMVEHPKLTHRVDAKRVAKAARRVNAYLAKQDPKAERRGEILDRIAAVAFVIFVIVLILFFVLLSRGAFDT